ncbi:MAG: cytidine deaminase, partial [Clostridia bacterium]|nr:cytidine deaminase [Clostridia bacterium]
FDTASGLGFCAERAAIAAMLTAGEHRIARVVALMPDGTPGAPCGACRELMMQLDGDSGAIEILLGLEPLRVVRLAALCPEWWGEGRFSGLN